MVNSIKCVSFTGHRPEKLMPEFDEKSEYILSIKAKLRQLIKKAIFDGYSVFYCGMAKGIDIMAGEIVADFIDKGFDIKLLAVIPYYTYANSWKDEWKGRFDRLLKSASRHLYIDNEYHRDTYLRRNRYLVENSDLLIAVRKGTEHSGTTYTIDYAKKLGLNIKIIEL